MSIEIRVPRVGESITEVRLGDWRKAPGDVVAADETLLELESEKATFELSAPSAGRLVKIVRESGSTVAIDEVIALFEEGAASDKPATKTGAAPPTSPPAAMPGPAPSQSESFVMPAAARALHQYGLAAEAVEATGPGGRMLKEDVERAARQLSTEKTSEPAPASGARAAAPADSPPPTSAPAPEPSHPKAAAPSKAAVATPSRSSAPTGELARPREARPVPNASGSSANRQDEIVAMTLLRKRIAERLVHAKQTAALLTTFNEVDMSAVLEVRNRFKESFLQKHGVKLGFMSFFVRAAVEALRAFPAVNAEIRGTDIVYHHYCDIGVAIGGGKGLVVPVLRNAETMGFAEIERRINDFATRAKDNALLPDDLQGGTFTISNGGVYGSMLSTPIVNPPQSGVLGMHAIQDRAVVVGGQIVVRPIMYLALTYDHRIVDGREAVTFLKRIKDSIEDPTRLMLEL